jgi:hypothetical protein
MAYRYVIRIPSQTITRPVSPTDSRLQAMVAPERIYTITVPETDNAALEAAAEANARYRRELGEYASLLATIEPDIVSGEEIEDEPNL